MLIIDSDNGMLLDRWIYGLNTILDCNTKISWLDFNMDSGYGETP
jgi:hypothetical protein